ncbi:hypothetical protein [Streptomyces sp. NPDC055681]
MDPIGTSAKYAPAASVGPADDSDSMGELGSGTTGAAVSVVTFAAATPRSVVITWLTPGESEPAPEAGT